MLPLWMELSWPRLDVTRKPDGSELVAAERCCLVVVALETGGRWSAEALSFVEEMARPGRETQHSGCRSAFHAWRKRWTRMLSVSCAKSFASSLVAGPTRCRGLMQRHLTWPTCLGRCERLLLCARISTVGCHSEFSCVNEKLEKVVGVDFLSRPGRGETRRDDRRHGSMIRSRRTISRYGYRGCRVGEATHPGHSVLRSNLLEERL